MYSLYANTLNEAQKMWFQKKTKTALLLAVLVPVLSAVLLDSLQSNAGIFVGRNLPLLMLELFTSVLLPLFLFMTAADSFAGEAAARTLNNVLLRPIARSNVFASKVLAIAMLAAVLLAVVWLASVLSGLVLDGGATMSGWIDGVQAYFAAFVSMIAVGLAAVFVIQWFRSSSAALALCMFLYIAAKALPFVYPQAAVWSVFSYTDWYALWVGNAASSGKLLNGFVFLLANSIICYTAGWYLFERKQF